MRVLENKASVKYEVIMDNYQSLATEDHLSYIFWFAEFQLIAQILISVSVINMPSTSQVCCHASYLIVFPLGIDSQDEAFSSSC